MSIDDRDLRLASKPLDNGLLRLELSVPGIHCGGCIRRIEGALGALSDVTSARVNLSTKRVTVCFREAEVLPAIGQTFNRLGFDAHLSGQDEETRDTTFSGLQKALAVAAFAAMNIMMLSVAIWAGADPATRQLFHWVSAFIALPALLYSGRVFYISAWQALRHGRTNMDVPISVGLFITYAMSLYDTVTGGQHAYFDAATALLFFLLIGRTLDHMMRTKARSAIDGLEKLAPVSVDEMNDDGTISRVSTAGIEPGMLLQIAAGDRVPVDGIVESGRSRIDVSLVSGESEPVSASEGASLTAGALNLTAPLVLRATSSAANSFLSDMVSLMETAEQTRHRFARLADRVASYYAPAVHLAALAAFLFWLMMGSGAHEALTIAISVLIITCPCALALAVPMVQVVASRKLFEAGILVKDGSALERLTQIDSVIFDKTGTLTSNSPKLLNADDISPDEFQIAAALAVQSRHPHARSIATAWQGSADMLTLTDITETAGAGIEGTFEGKTYRLGRIGWAADDGAVDHRNSTNGPVLAQNGNIIASFDMVDPVRPEAFNLIRRIEQMGLPVGILSGDSAKSVSRVASQLGVEAHRSLVSPEDKLEALDDITADGGMPLMVGDGINDAPALAAAHVSIAPASATDIGRTAADIVLLKDKLGGILTAFDVAQRANRLVFQNIGFALAYNLVAVPFAFLGFITPLYAAIAMSTSSIVVVANALRLTSPKTSPPSVAVESEVA